MQQDDNTVLVQGTTMHRTPPTVKLEGAAVRGVRCVGLSLEHEEHAEHAEHEEQRAAVAPPAALEEDGELEFVYGVNGVETRALDKSVNEEELGVFISVTSDLKHAAKVSTVAFGLACTNISRCLDVSVWLGMHEHLSVWLGMH